MALTDSRLAYDDIFKILDRAIESPLGIRVKFADRGAAFRFRTRLHYARNIDRKDNKANFDPDHPMFGRSIYDSVTVKDPVKEGPIYWLYIHKLDGENLEIEELSDVNQTTNGNHGAAERESSREGSGEEAVEEVSEAVRSAVAGLIRRI